MSKFKYKILSLTISCAVFFTFFPSLFAINSKAIDVSAASAALYDSFTGEYYYQKNADIRRPMASTTKIMTAIAALEYGDLDDIVTVKREAAAIEGSRMYLVENEKISLKELLYGLMLSSGNDAAMAIADHVGGSTEDFADMMNDIAARLGLENTSFENPSGLDSDNHFTTASELAKIAAFAMKNPIFREIVSCKFFKTSGNHMLSNHNKLLKLYKYATGIKTGFTKKSGRCLVSSAQKNGRELIAVTLNAPDDWNDHIRMLDYGFSLFSERYSLDKNTAVTSIPIVGAGSAGIYPENDISLYLTKEEKQNLEIIIIGRKFLYPPVYDNQIYGELIIMSDGIEYAKTNLIFREKLPHAAS